MDFAEFERKAAEFSYECPMHEPVFGLAEETGEVVGKFKKLSRDKQVNHFHQIYGKDRDAVLNELGDVLWYLTEIARRMGSGLKAVAHRNIAKLSDRRERGVLQGEGDNR